MRIFRRFWMEILFLQKSILHILAMYCPYMPLKRVFYRSRGTKMGRNVYIGSMVYLEEYYSNLITIENDVEIAPRVNVATHDSSYHCIDPKSPIEIKAVTIKKDAYIGTGAIILPGVTIGEYSIVAAGAVVAKDVPPRTIVAGVPARVTGTVDKSLIKFKNKEKKNEKHSERV